MPDSPREPVAALRLEGISKRFGKVVANDAISLALAPGEVLALLGENGAGKSTLVSILFGHYLADEGTIEVFGVPLPPGNPKAALAAGIGMVHQHFTLADNLSVLDNVMLGNEPLWRPFSRRGAARARLAETGRRFGLQVDPESRVGALSVGERQRVEILKALVSGQGTGQGGTGARILILDEPTAVLTPAVAQSLFATLRGLVAQGLAVIFISHKLDEVLAVSDRVAVLRGGRLVATLATADADKAGLAELMVGREVPVARRVARQVGGVVCALRAPDVNLTLRAGEIVAVAGVAGNGQQALAEVLCGLREVSALAPRHRPSPAVRAAAFKPLPFGRLGACASKALPHLLPSPRGRGRKMPSGASSIGVTLAGRGMRPRPRDWIAAGVARIPEDRHALGVVGDLPVWENALLERYATAAFARFGVIRRGAARAFARALVERFDVRGVDARTLSTPARALSGGNMQKLILGRALMGDPADPKPPLLIVADQPTWGLDIGAVAYVHQQLLDACAQGSAVLLISEDLDEIFALADRIAVLHAGRLGPVRATSQWTLAAIGLAMAGGEPAPTDRGTADAA